MVHFDDNSFGSILKGNLTYISLVPEKLVAEVNGLNYFKWKLDLDENGIAKECNDLHEQQIVHYCVLLPLFHTNISTTQHTFALVTSDWKVMHENGIIQIYTY